MHSTMSKIELNCVGRNNGFANSSINNGSTSHDGCNVIRINFEYYSNKGAQIAESGSNRCFLI